MLAPAHTNATIAFCLLSLTETMPIGMRLSLILALAAAAATVLGRWISPLLGWGFFTLFLLGLLAMQARQLARAQAWSLQRNDAPPPPAIGFGAGVWDDLLSSWYRQGRAQQRRLERLGQTLQDFQEAAQALPDGVVILNAEDRIEWANPIAQVHLGLQLPADIGQLLTNLMRASEFGRYLREGPQRAPLTFRVETGRPRTLLVQLVRYGQTHRLLMSRDVTQVERLETMRRDFIANVSHELRTPLTVLSGFLETLRDLPAEALTPAQQAHYLDLMFDQAQRMQAIVSDLLTLSTLESTPPPEPRPVGMPGLLSSLRPPIEALSNGRHVFSWEIDETLDIRGIESELASACSNLLSNAVRYTAEGGAIKVSWQRNAQGLAVFRVRDSGIGIAPEHIPRLTERFYRVDRGRSRESGGTGLGLAIVKHIALRHHAELRIDSTPGEGSVFSLLFDRIVPPPEAASAAALIQVSEQARSS